MAKKQKIVREGSASNLDFEVNKLLLDGWERSGEPRLVIKQSNNNYGGSTNTEIWYQTLTKYNEETK